MKYLKYTLSLIFSSTIAMEENDCPYGHCSNETAKHLSTIDDIWSVEYQDEI